MTGDLPIGSVFAVSKSGYALQVTGGAQIDTLKVSGNMEAGSAEISGKLTAASDKFSVDASGNLAAASASIGQALSVGSCFQVSESGGVQCLSTGQAVKQIGEGLFGVNYYNNFPMPSDGIVTMSMVPLLDNGEPTYDQWTFVNADSTHRGQFQAWTSAGPMVNFTGNPPYKSYGRADIVPLLVDDSQYAISCETITLPVCQGDYFGFLIYVSPGIPAKLGILISIALFAHDVPPIDTSFVEIPRPHR
jgi:hypothetical protein